MVPERWITEKLYALLLGNIKNGYSPVASEKETGYWVLGLGALGDDGLNPSGIKPVELTDKVQSALLSPGDFLVSRSNTPDKVGRSVLFKGEVPRCAYPDLMMRFRVDPNSVDPGFMEHKLKTHGVRKYFQNSAAGSSGSMVKINKGILENTPILLPPILEQKKIALILSTWDQTITATERLLENSRRRKNGLMQQLLTGKKRLPGFEGEWKSVPLGEVLVPKKSKSGSASHPVYSVTKYGLVSQEEYFNKPVAADDLSGYLVVDQADFVMSGLNFWMGSVDVHTKSFPVIVSPAYKVFSLSEIADSDYFRHLIRTCLFKRILEGSSVMGASVVRRNFNKELFMEWPIKLPPISEQEAISRVVEAENALIHSLSSKLLSLKQEKKALMQKLLTGKLRVKVDAEAA